MGYPSLDVPGCISAGDTIDETLANGAEALAFHLEGMLEDGMPCLSRAASRQSRPIRTSDSSSASRHVLVLMPVCAAQPHRPHQCDDGRALLVEAIDKAAKSQGGTRSGFLAQLARERLGIH